MIRRGGLVAFLVVVAGTPLAASELAPGVELLPGRFVQGPQPDGNTVVLRGASGLIAIDTGRHAEHTQAIVDFARRSRLPIAAVINTHWHLDHIAGNAPLRDAFPGLRVYASDALPAALKGFLATYHRQLTEAIAKTDDAARRASWQAELARVDAGEKLAPDEVVDRSGEWTLAGRKLELQLTDHAVTAADLWIFDPATRILVAGDLVTLPVPLFDTACAAHWKEALDELARHEFVQLVPGHGPPLDRPRFETYRRSFDHLVACAASAQEKSTCIDGWMHDAAELVAGEDPAWVRSILDYYLDTNLRADAEHRASLCAD